MSTEFDYSEVLLLVEDFFRFLEALAKDGFRFDIRNPYRFSPRPRLWLAFHGDKLVQSNSVDVPFTFGGLDYIGVSCSHLDKLIARKTICLVNNSPFADNYVI